MDKKKCSVDHLFLHICLYIPFPLIVMENQELNVKLDSALP